MSNSANTQPLRFILNTSGGIVNKKKEFTDIYALEEKLGGPYPEGGLSGDGIAKLTPADSFTEQVVAERHEYHQRVWRAAQKSTRYMNTGEINHDPMFKPVGRYNAGGLNQVRGELEIDGHSRYKNRFYFTDDALEIAVKSMTNTSLGVLPERIREGVNVVYDQARKVGYVEDLTGQAREFPELMGRDMVEVEFSKAMEYTSDERRDLKESIVGIGQNGALDDYHPRSRDFSVQFKDVTATLTDLRPGAPENTQRHDVAMVRESAPDAPSMRR
tara:strand:- start:6946 stop:7764 length:819 start_codon:yes stop_codon:yes gene_type:complete